MTEESLTPQSLNGSAKPNELLAWWIDQQVISPSSRDKGKQAAAAKRICEDYARDEIAAAVYGMSMLFPYSEGRPWDLMDLERSFLRAATKALRDHPTMKEHRRRESILDALADR